MSFRQLGLFCVSLSLLSIVACGGGARFTGPSDGAVGGAPKMAAQAPPMVMDAENQEEANTEEYSRIIENPYRLVTQTPRSTLSIDVDTASYSNVRRHLNEGKLPPKDAVRIEEMINYFTYSYPQPQGKHPVSITTNIVQCPWEQKHHLVRIALKGREIPAEQLPARNLVFLLDTSGSMNSPNKLPLLQSSLRLLVKQLNENDRVAIVTYAGRAGLVLPSTPGNQQGRILQAIDNLTAGGSTNGGEGIQLAYRVAQEGFRENGLNRVMLGTDGDFNVGVSSTGELTRLIEEKRKSGIYLSVLGLGMGNYKDARLEQLAHHGNGHFAYIDSQAEAHKLFVEQGGALFTIAKDVKLQIEFNPTKVAAYRLIGYENRLLKDEDFNNDQKDAGDMGSGHTVTAFYEIVPAGESVEVPGIDPLKYQKAREPIKGKVSDEWLTVKLRYKDPKEEQSQLLTQALKGEPEAFEKSPDDFQFAVAVAAFGHVLRDSKYKGTATLDDVAKIAGGARGNDPHGHRGEFLKLINSARGLKR